MEVSDSQDQPITMLSFRIFGPELEPEKVSQELALVPDHTHLKDGYPHNNPKYSPYNHGMWIMRSKLPDEETLPAHLESLLSVLEPKQEQIVKLSKDHTVDFYCTLYSQNGFQLSPYLLERIANIGAALGVTVYPSEMVSGDDDLADNSP